MTEGARPYRSALRDEQSRTTRRRIVDAGGELFVAHGYVPTTIDAIAERAGVSRQDRVHVGRWQSRRAQAGLRLDPRRRRRARRDR